MRVVQHGVRQKEPAPYAGKMGQCSSCTCIVELEENDDPKWILKSTTSLGTSSVYNVFIVPCPECGEKIEILP